LSLDIITKKQCIDMKKFITHSIGFRITLFYFLLTLINLSFVISVIFENQVELITRNAKLESERQFLELIDAAKHFVDEARTGGLFAHEKDTENLSRFIKVITPYAPNYAIITENNRVIGRSSERMTIPETATEDIMRAITAKNFSGKDYYLRVDEKKKNIYCYILLGDTGQSQTVLLTVKGLGMLDESLGALYRQALFIIIVVLVFHSLFALALFRYIINPLRLLEQGAVKLSHGDLKARISISNRNDEIASVAQSFNTMADSISSSIERLSGEVNTARDSLQRSDHLSIKDGLTDLPNRTYMLERIKEEIELSKTRNTAPALFLVGINDLDEIAEIYGRQAENIILLEISKIVARNCAGREIVSRFAHDRFALLSIDSSPEHARSLAEAIRSETEKKTIVTPDSSFSVTVNIGAAIHNPAAAREHESGAGLLSSAESALARSRQAGKNRIAVV